MNTMNTMNSMNKITIKHIDNTLHNINVTDETTFLTIIEKVYNKLGLPYQNFYFIRMKSNKNIKKDFIKIDESKYDMTLKYLDFKQNDYIKAVDRKSTVLKFAFDEL